MARTVAIGIQDFNEIIEKNYFYIDKTEFIKEWWEAGKCYPQADNLVALAILYDVSPMELLVEEDVMSSSCYLWENGEVLLTTGCLN